MEYTNLLTNALHVIKMGVTLLFPYALHHYFLIIDINFIILDANCVDNKGLLALHTTLLVLSKLRKIIKDFE